MTGKTNDEFIVRQATLDDLEIIVGFNTAMALETESIIWTWTTCERVSGGC